MKHILPWNNGLFSELQGIIQQNIQAIDPDLAQYFTGYPSSKHQLFSTDSGWAARVDLPGYTKEEVKLNFEEHTLKLTAENKTRGKRNLRISLGDEVETNKISAKLENGILEIILPKQESPSSEIRNINIQ